VAENHFNSKGVGTFRIQWQISETKNMSHSEVARLEYKL